MHSRRLLGCLGIILAPFIIYILILMFTLIFVPEPTLPYGIWHSEEAGMTFFIDPELSLRWSSEFPGVYVRNGEKINIAVSVDMKFDRISINENIDIDDRTAFLDEVILGGYRLRNDRLYITLWERNIETDEFDTIVFELVQ